MTTYIAITDPETDPDAPLTSELAKKWRDNAIAIGEGDTTAPVNAACWHPYDMVFANDGAIGRFYNGTAVSSVETPDFVDGYDYRVRGVLIRGTSNSSPNFTLEVYRDINAAYNPAATMLSAVNADDYISFSYIINEPRKVKNVHHFGDSTLVRTANPIPSNTSPTATSHTFITAQGIRRIRFAITLGNWTTGQMFLDKRRNYTTP